MEMQPKLKELQEWFYSTVTNRSGVEEGAMNSTFGKQYSKEGDVIQQLIHPSKSLTSADRMAIYRNAYFLRLKGVFDAEYPVLQFALGEQLFDRFVLLFIQKNPPQNYTLHDLSSRFVAFLIASQPEEDRKELWPRFIIELAQLERIFQEVYHGAGDEELSEEERTATATAIKLAKGLEVSSASLRLLKCQFPVHQFLNEVKQSGTADFPPPKKCHLIIHRKKYTVYIQEIEKNEFDQLANAIN